MLIACRLAGLSALETYYAGGRARAQCGPTQSPIAASPHAVRIQRLGRRPAQPAPAPQDAGEFCARFHDANVRNVKAKRVQCDEIWSFTYAKEKNVARAKAAPEALATRGLGPA